MEQSDREMLSYLADKLEEQEKKIEHVLELGKENHYILHGMQVQNIRALVFRLIKMTITVGVIFYAYYLFQPILQSVGQTYDQIQNITNQADEIKSKLPNLPFFPQAE